MAKQRLYPVCPRCADRHHTFAYCRDGVKRVKNAPHFEKGNLKGAALATYQKGLAKMEAAQTNGDFPVTPAPALAMTAPAATEASPAPPSAASAAREDLRTIAASLPEGSQQRRSIELLLERDQAREQHQRDEETLRTLRPDARLPVPTVLRDLSEDKGRHLNLEMDRLLYQAGVGRDFRPGNPVADSEAAAVHGSIASIRGNRERKESQAREAAKPPEHMNGDQPWACHGCGSRFRSGTLEQVRRKARAEPGWRFVCPSCRSSRVELIQAVAV